MKKKEPLVSVILPVYNRVSVCKTIESILTQTYKNIELIVIDNASTDETCDEIRKIKDDRIKLFVNEKNMGQTYSINRGLELAKGKYIARIDSDDLALPTRIEKQVCFLEENPEYVLCGSWIQFITDYDELTLVVKTCTTDEGLRFLQTITCGIYHPTAMYRSDIIRSNNIRYNPQIAMAEDYDMWFQLMQYGKAANLGEVLVYYRRGNSNDSTVHKDIMTKECFDIRKKICSIQNWENDKKVIMNRNIILEEKSKKNIREIIAISKFLLSYFKNNVKRDSLDYNIIKRQIYLKIYVSCFANNNSILASSVQKIYNIIRGIFVNIGKKLDS